MFVFSPSAAVWVLPMERRHGAEALRRVARLCQARGGGSNTALVRAKALSVARCSWSQRPITHVTDAQRTMVVPRLQVFQQALNTLSIAKGSRPKWATQPSLEDRSRHKAQIPSIAGGGHDTEREGELGEPTEDGLTRHPSSVLHQKEARRTRRTPNTGMRGTLTPSPECFHCLWRPYQGGWMSPTILSTSCNKNCQWLLIGNGLKRARNC